MRSDEKIGLCKLIMFFSIFLTIMCLINLLFVDVRSGEFVILIIALVANVVTIIGSRVYIIRAMKNKFEGKTVGQ
ncbi:hypothetical protein SAMN02746089_01093 [Caldanaerobius fijiensis DSM 17918]|uniref:Uncharacterized protein n=1 Tax=Caldanaerobius fijiensis DSM 17918 TaxID=1121256 RepID=A0A1M4XWQ5_9THEO|nr:hypothetical protein [Caldanaerobius fijiensis]SHE97858.1 hypothetical protein SAMN02746089_01093 [Caldanaerobius fijiensis DSM 17918]